VITQTSVPYPKLTTHQRKFVHGTILETHTWGMGPVAYTRGWFNDYEYIPGTER